MKQTFLFQSILILILIAFACQDDNDVQKVVSLEKLNGYVQKGPFLNGTSITVYELNDDLEPTGKNYPSQIFDNKGTFEVKNVDLISQYVLLKADGFYFDEVANASSQSQLTLYALSDITSSGSLNANVLSTLERGRVEYLISQGKRLDEAKKQALSEILDIFEMNKSDMSESEKLDISKPGDDNAILLAISCILQGHLPVADLSELLANISSDIREDGILNNQELGSTLVNNARGLKLDQIRKNLESRYKALNLNVTVSDFEKYVNQFISNTAFIFTNIITYPEQGKYGYNILDKTKTDYPAGQYSMKVKLYEGNTLKVKIKGLNYSFPSFQENTGWEYSDQDANDFSRTFTSTKTGEIDFRIDFFRANANDTLASNMNRILVYENGATQPTWQKLITVTR